MRREFKICGQIGENEQKDKLSYLSLVHQIENGSEKGHSETEIIEAVIRAISPGMPVRDMLEIKWGLTLSKLLTILKRHYKVDRPTELYHQLLNISQKLKETALNSKGNCYVKQQMRRPMNCTAGPQSSGSSSAPLKLGCLVTLSNISYITDEGLIRSL